ncbi:MAG: hypothetical protein ACE5NG_04370 [bacterium]
MKANPPLFSVLLIFVFGFIGCERGSNLNEPGVISGSEYFPLQVGNRWHYELQNSEGFDSEVEIVGTTKIESHEYFIFKNSYNNGSQIDSSFFRADSDDKVFTYCNGEDVLYIDFKRAAGELWDSCGNLTGVILKKSFKTTVPAGVFDNSVEVFFDISFIIDEEQWKVFAPGVGMIEQRGQIGALQLTSAFVNGVAIPYRMDPEVTHPYKVSENNLSFLGLLITQSCEHFITFALELKYREIPWNDLTAEERATVIADWRKAKIQEESVQFQGRDVVSATFRTTMDALLGPIVIFIDKQTKEVVGRAPRFYLRLNRTS